jgi:hypothetical protein
MRCRIVSATEGRISMTRDEYDSLCRQVAEEHRKNVEALDRVFRLSQGLVTKPGRSIPDSIKPDGEQSSERKKEDADESRGTDSNGETATLGKGELLAAVRKAIGRQVEIANAFTILDVIERLQEQGTAGKKASVGSVFSRLEQKGIIEVLKRGAGRRATVYQLRSSM